MPEPSPLRQLHEQQMRQQINEQIKYGRLLQFQDKLKERDEEKIMSECFLCNTALEPANDAEIEGVELCVDCCVKNLMLL